MFSFYLVEVIPDPSMDIGPSSNSDELTCPISSACRMLTLVDRLDALDLFRLSCHGLHGLHLQWLLGHALCRVDTVGALLVLGLGRQRLLRRLWMRRPRLAL